MCASGGCVALAQRRRANVCAAVFKVCVAAAGNPEQEESKTTTCWLLLLCFNGSAGKHALAGITRLFTFDVGKHVY